MNSLNTEDEAKQASSPKTGPRSEAVAESKENLVASERNLHTTLGQQSPPGAPSGGDWLERHFKKVLIGAVFVLAGVVVFSPHVAYNPVPRTVLFFIIAVVFALLFDQQLKDNNVVKLQGVWGSVTLVGVAAVVFALLFLLAFLSKPDIQVANYTIRRSHQDLELDGKVVVRAIDSTVQPEYFARGSQLLVIFPDQTQQVEVEVSPNLGETYRAVFEYKGNRKWSKDLKTDFKKVQP